MRRKLPFVLVMLVLVAAPSRADDDAIQAVRTELQKVRDELNRSCPGNARKALPEAERKLAALNEFEREKVASDVESTKRNVAQTIEDWNADRAKHAVESALEQAEGALSSVDSDPVNAQKYMKQALETLDARLADDVNKPLVTAELRSKSDRKVEWIKGEYKKGLAKFAKKAWEQELRNAQMDGWEQDQARPIAEVVKAYGHDLGCRKSESFVRAAAAWLGNPVVVEAKETSGDADLEKLWDDVVARRAKAEAKVVECTKSVLSEAEKLPAGEGRTKLIGYYQGELGRYFPDEESGPAKGGRKRPARHGKRDEWAPGGEEVGSRIKALVSRWEGEAGKEKADTEGLIARLRKQSDDAWPGIASSYSLSKLETSEALKDINSWKGKLVRVAGENWAGGAYEDQYYAIVEVDGVPVCGDTDDALGALADAHVKETGISLGAVEELVGAVEGECKVWQRVRRGDRMVRGEQVDAIRLRIVALKTETFAGSTSGGGGGGFVHHFHRFVAWGMCALLAIAGFAALGHGAARFVPSLQTEHAKTGNYLSYGGIFCAVVGAFWFLATLVLPFLSAQVRFGSLPSVALALAGMSLAVDLLRAKGKIPEETARTIQPVGIVLGLACFGAAAAHFFFWDWPLL